MSYGVGQSWGALRKALRAHKIAKAHGDTPGMEKYTERIQTLQRDIGLPQAHFPEIGLN